MRKFLFLIAGLVAMGCATTGERDFEHLKINMIKDEVLEEVGSPNRSEIIDGKEKWTYRFYSGPEKNVERLMHVTFVDGKVLTFGEDTDELKRKEEIQKDNDNKPKLRAAKKAAAAQQSASDTEVKKSVEPEAESESEPAKPAVFIEQKGKHAPVTHESE